MSWREEFLAFAQAGRACLPVRFEECWELAVDETADPEVIVEYELGGTVTTIRHAAAPFIGVLRVRDGQVTGWREYQDTIAIAFALGQVASTTGQHQRGDRHQNRPVGRLTDIFNRPLPVVNNTGRARKLRKLSAHRVTDISYRPTTSEARLGTSRDQAGERRNVG